MARIRVIIDKPASAVSCVMPTAVTRLYIASRCRPMLDHCLVIRYRANAAKQDGSLSIASSNSVAGSIPFFDICEAMPRDPIRKCPLLWYAMMTIMMVVATSEHKAPRHEASSKRLSQSQGTGASTRPASRPRPCGLHIHQCLRPMWLLVRCMRLSFVRPVYVGDRGAVVRW